MSSIKSVELRAQRAAAHEQAKALVARAELENRNLTAEEQVSFDSIHAGMEELRTRFERIEASDRIESELSETRGRVTEYTSVSADEQNSKAEARNAAFTSYLRHGIEGVTSEQRNSLNEMRAQSVGTTTAGGFLVPQGFSGQLEESMLAFGGMREVATRLVTESGNPLPWPTANDASNKGAILAENTAAVEQDVTFGSITFNSFKYSSKMIKVSVELLQDSAFDLNAYLAKALGERIARIVNEHCTTGAGTTLPRGIMVAAGPGITAAAGAAITADELIELVHSVDAAYRKGGTFMMNDQTVKAIRKLKDTTGQYIWQPGLASGVADSLLGHKVVVNNDVATMAINAKSVAFGDMSKYVIRDVSGIVVRRLDERFADAAQVGFLALSRHDGNLLDAGTDPVKVITQAAV